jgi:Tfp pilus assembly protein PilF
MSLINDALKTAQRERSGHAASGPGGQPLLEGFFPYVSTSSPEGRSKLGRILVVSGLAIVVLGAAAWLSMPSLKKLLGGRADASSIVLPPHQPMSIPPRPGVPAVQVVQVADTQPTVVARDSSVPAARTALAPTEKSSPASDTGAPRSIVTVVRPAARERDTVIVDPSAALASAPEPRVVRPNYEGEAVAAFNAGDYPTARSRFELAVRVAPTASAWTNYGVTLEKLGQPQAAMRAYRSATAIDANYFNAWLYLARVYNVLGDVTQAVPLFDRARELEPNNSDVNADLAELEYKSGAFVEARRFADVAARSNPANSRAQYYLALAADTLRDRGVARQAFESYLRTMAGQERENAASVGYARVRLQELKGKP